MQKNENSHQVLIIDDEKDLCFLLQTICEQKGLTVHIAHNLKEAGTELDQNPDLIFLDNNLPDGLGIEFINTIRVHTKNSFVIMMTAQNSDKLQKQIIESGINCFLLKPFDSASVINLIEQNCILSV